MVSVEDPDINISKVLGYMRYINLEHRRDRKQHIEEQLKAFYPKAEPRRLDAIRDTYGHLGCALSHVKLIDEALADESKPEYVCVFEDDALFINPSKTLQNLKRVIKQEYPWDVILLGCAARKSTPIDTNVHRVSSASATHAFIVRRSFLPVLRKCFTESADMLRRRVNEQKACIDQHWKTLMDKYTFLTFVPMDVKQLPNQSDISNGFTDYTMIMKQARLTNPGGLRVHPVL